MPPASLFPMFPGFCHALALEARFFSVDGGQNLSLLNVGSLVSLNSKILSKLRDNNGVLAVSDKSAPEVISNHFGVSKGNFKKAIGALYKEGKIAIHADRIELI